MAVSFYFKRSSTASKRPLASGLAAGELALNFSPTSPGLFFCASDSTLVKVGPAQVSATAPNSSPAVGGETGNTIGEFWYDTANSLLKLWNGSAWCTAGSNLSGAFSAKGQLLAGTGASAYTALAVGINGQVLVACSTATSGLSWTSIATGGDYLPIGATAYFAANAVPADWLVADGSAVSRTTYALLFAAIGTTYGAGNGSTTFNLPDLRGMFLRGWDAAGGSARGCDPGRVFGSTQQDEFRSHAHAYSSVPGGAGQIAVGNSWGPNPSVTNAAGGAETRPMNVAMLPCIKFQFSGPAPSSFTAKGDLLVGTGASAYSALPVGTAGQVLTVDAACAGGVKWAAAGGGSAATPLTLGTVYGCTSSTNVSLGEFGMESLTSGTGNTAVGYIALDSVTTGICNTALGLGAAYNATGNNNTAVGVCALPQTTTGCSNVGLGHLSGCNISSGSRNVAIGPNVRVATGTASCQLAIGYSAVANWITGDSSLAIQPGAGIIDCAGSCGTAGQVLASTGANAVCWTTIGVSAATPTTLGTVLGCTANYNTSLGCQAGNSLTTGLCNVSVGCGAMASATTACYNTAVGYCSTYFATSGCYNTAIGGCSITQLTTGKCNVAVGHKAGNGVTTGCNNVAIGSDVTVASATGFGQLALGYDFGCHWLTGDSTKAIQPGAGIIDCAGSCGTAGQALTSTGTNALEWSNTFRFSCGTALLPGMTPTGDTNTGFYSPAADTLAFVTNGCEAFRVPPDGRLSVGNTCTGAITGGGGINPRGIVAALGYQSRSGPIGAFSPNIFNIYWTGSGANLYIDYVDFGAISVSSDYRIKKDVEPLEEDCISRLKDLKPVKYHLADYNDLFKADGVQREGFIAHELAEVVPSAVVGEKDAENQIQSLKMDALVAVLTKALQQAVERIETLEAQMNVIKGL